MVPDPARRVFPCLLPGGRGLHGGLRGDDRSAHHVLVQGLGAQVVLGPLLHQGLADVPQGDAEILQVLADLRKEMTFQLARMRWPHAKIFSLTSGAAVMKMNTELGTPAAT